MHTAVLLVAARPTHMMKGTSILISYTSNKHTKRFHAKWPTTYKVMEPLYDTKNNGAKKKHD